MEYKKCLVQLDEVLNYLSIENIEKIPLEIRNSIKQQKDKEYIWKYDKSKALKEQELDRITVALLSYLNMEYLLNPEQKEYMETIHKINEQKIEKEKQKQDRYNYDNLFNNKTSTAIQEENISENVAIVEYKESLFKKIINKIKKFFIKIDSSK